MPQQGQVHPTNPNYIWQGNQWVRKITTGATGLNPAPTSSANQPLTVEPPVTTTPIKNLGGDYGLTNGQQQEGFDTDTFNKGLMEMMQRHQKLGTEGLEPFREKEFASQEAQAGRVAEKTPDDLIGANPSIQGAVRMASAQALDPTIQGATQAKGAFIDRLNALGSNMDKALELGQWVEGIERQEKEDGLNFLFKFPGAVQAMDEDTKKAFAKKIGMSVDIIDAIPSQEEADLKTQVEEINGRKVLINSSTGETIKDLGASDENIKPPTTEQWKVAGFASRIQEANKIIDSLDEQFSSKTSLGGLLPGFLDILKGDDRRKLEQAQRNYVNAVLRRESGAAISDTEFSSASKQYFPSPGDSAEVLQQKKDNRELILKNLIAEAGNAFTQPPDENIEVPIPIQTLSNGKNLYQGKDGDTFEATEEEWYEIWGGFNNDLSKSVNGSSEIKKIASAIGQYESGGNYQIRGPVVDSGQYKGERALGKYQIMPGNLSSWSKEALGRSVSEQEFLSNPDIQDKIAEYKMNNIYKQYGNLEDVASVWFSGRPVNKAGNAKDVLGTSVSTYIKNIKSIYNNLA